MKGDKMCKDMNPFHVCGCVSGEVKGLRGTALPAPIIHHRRPQLSG